MREPVLQRTPAGLYCTAGDFYIDPWAPVERAVITHAHADHARPGSARYLCARPGLGVLRLRMGNDAHIRAIDYGERLTLGGAIVSLHPAGHLLGSAQVRVEVGGEVWVVSGDYKREIDATCRPMEAVRCDCFITESTFALPIYRWRPQAEVFEEINQWWRANQAAGRTSVLYAYALGKAQRLLAGIDQSIGPILAHGAVMRLMPAYAAAAIALPPVVYADSESAKAHRGQALVVAPPSGSSMTGWLRKFGATSEAFASGWMQVRGARRRRAVDRGFVLSDHADWDGVLDAVAESGAAHVGVTHGYTSVLARYLRERGLDAFEVRTQWEGGDGESGNGEADGDWMTAGDSDDNSDGSVDGAIKG
jgi:putative mRNA 3-end processing factor